MNQQIAIREQNHLAPTSQEFEIMLKQSQMLVKTGFLPSSIKSPEQALAIILTGRELGIPAMAALNTINVIQQKPTISPQLMLALIERSGKLEDIQINSSKDSASCTMKRRGRSPHTEIFGQAEAMKLRLLDKDNYKKQASTMFKWRAVAACARVVFADVILGFYTPDEMGAETENELLPETITETKTVPTEDDFNFRDNSPKAEFLPQNESPVSPETKGKLLAESGAVGQSAKGYTVSETIEGETVIFDITKTNGVVACTCRDYAEMSKWEDTYKCAHKWAAKFSALAKTAVA